MENDSIVRQQLINLLVKQQAHMSFEDAVAGFPAAHINTRPPNVEYTFWHLIEHIRICQWDILDYIVNSKYVGLPFPEGYWSERASTTDIGGWQKTVDQLKAERQALIDIIKNPATDLYAQIPHGYAGHNILREIHVVADHNAYHTGELGILRQVMGLW